MDIQDYSRSWHITYHFVWGPMRSKPCLVGMIAERLQELIREKARGREFEPLAVVILPDRVYLAVAAPPTLAPHHIVCQVKAHTSRVLRDEFPELTRIPTLWTRAYLVMAGDELPTEEVLQRYEAMQQPRRPRGRPRKVGPSDDEEDDAAST
ncbi:MAG TPA: IS200/IS605 family transposase [Ktedonobacterales bacterium]|nr:IS200/IS605 family transposase [Ktedonobacterales bacterium]